LRVDRRQVPVEVILLVALAGQIALFSAIAPNFATVGNFFEISRLSVELGLLAIALTPILVTGGIDLSVGAMMGLAAILFGVAWTDWGLSIPAAAAVALLSGCAGGGLNAVLVARLNIPPLIVTLGTLSLFRGIAEGITHAAVNYTGFPAGFLQLGQGYVWGVLPAQLPIFVAVFVAYVVLLHRSVIGRALYAIGFSPAGARFAGIPVARRVGLVYFLSGVVSSLAGIIYVAHLGQARSDAGSGYELDAITAVVLGGTSVFGGRGTLGGTLLGLFALAVLRNGLRLAALPSELAGVLTGTLLLATIAVDRLRWAGRARAAVPQAAAAGGRGQASPGIEGEFHVKNSQVAVLCAAVIAGALIIASTNAWLVRSLTTSPHVATAGASFPGGRRPVIAMMPKAKGDPYFVSCLVGAEEAADELGVELIWDGPTGLDAARQNEVIENWITRRVDVIAVAVENRASISTALRKARERGITVLTWDADAEPTRGTTSSTRPPRRASAPRSTTKRRGSSAAPASSRSSPARSARRTRTSGSPSFGSGSRAASRPAARHHPTERRRPRQGVRRTQTIMRVQSQRAAHHGHLGTRPCPAPPRPSGRPTGATSRSWACRCRT
jgi:rhamnose transport system substrate-binding protein